jgi:hypothetical protein
VTGAFDGLPFADAVKDGLSAISDRVYRNRIYAPEHLPQGYSISSVDIDARMRAEHPRANRWDYGISHGANNKRIEFIEFHAAESGEVEVVTKKQRWLKNLMVGCSLPPHTWKWIPTGKNKILPHSNYLRRLTDARIILIRGNLQL